MKFSKLFMSNSLVAFLSFSLTADAGVELVNGQNNHQDSEDCKELLTSESSTRKMKLELKPLPVKVKLDYADEIQELRKKLVPADESAKVEIERIRTERDIVRERIESIRDQELSLQEIKAMEDVSWGVHATWELSHVGRLPMLTREREKLERKEEALDAQVNQRIPALVEQLRLERGYAENRKSQLGQALSDSMKADLSQIVLRLSQNDLLPDGDKLKCANQDWRLYEIKKQVTRPTMAKVEKLIEEAPVVKERLLALSLCQVDDPGGAPIYVRLGFLGNWNPTALELELVEMSYQRLDR